MNSALSHSTLLHHDEVMKAVLASKSRQLSLTWLVVVLMVGLILAVEAGHRFGFWFVQQLPFSVMFSIGANLPTAFVTLFAFLVVLAVGSIQNWVMRRAYLRNFKALEIPIEIEANYEILPEGLRLSTDRISIFPKWTAIDRLERIRGDWVLSADQLTFFIPKAGFADEAAERAFMSELFERLGPKARERSEDAAAFFAMTPPPPAG